MSTTLTNGLKLPDKGSVDWYADMQSNYTILDGAVGTVADHTTALSGKAGLSDNNTFSGDNTFHNITPGANNTYNLGSSSYQWNNIYSKGYYYNGVAWGLDKANTWTGSNSFSGITLVNSSWSGVTPPSSAKPTVIEFKSSDTRQGRYINRIGVNSAETWIETIRNVDANTSHNFTVIMQVDNSGNKKLLPYNSDADLGNSTSNSNGRWKTLNGINPGALSLPDYNDPDPINFNQWSVPGNNAYTPSVDGWLCIIIKDSSTNSIFVFNSGMAQGPKQYCASVYGNGTQGSGRLALMCPVRAALQYTIILRGESVSDIYAVRFYPCCGNV